MANKDTGKQLFSGPKGAGGEKGRDVSLDMTKAEAVTHLGGDDYMVTISGVNHRIQVEKTNTATLLAGGDAASQ